MKRELLAPAGDERSARAALGCGADAVYLGLDRFSARDRAENFDAEALVRTVRYAHLLGAKVYVCLNTLVKDGELEAFFESARTARNAGADALLIQDLFLGKRLKEVYPELELHLSTQAGCCNVRGARMAKECGFSRVVLARETPLEEIGQISSVIETEVFVQGALCTCFSGQCYLSSFAGNHSGNRGKCKQPCRKRYSIDRKGFEGYAYALSPADLCVGERLTELSAAGVSSFKIEGRLRRPEYVAAAVSYYRDLLAGAPAERSFSDLKRAYNRGDYTAGLAFGQEKSYLSRKVQGHIGERVGFLRGGDFCASSYVPHEGDGFKILRGGEEVGGAVFRCLAAGGFRISSHAPLREGDEVRLTTDASLPERSRGERKREISLSLRFVAGEPAEASCGEFSFSGEVVAPARSAPLTAEELISCFSKTDALPLAVTFGSVVTENAFLPKSRLNAFRRAFYAAYADSFAPSPLPARPWDRPALPRAAAQPERAVIAEEMPEKADIFILKPRDYSSIPDLPAGEGVKKRYLYLPPFFSSRDEALVLPALSRFDGIYCDGYYGLSLARERGMAFFAGTGFNLTNRISVEEVFRTGARYALSKELDVNEQVALSGEGAFTLREGGIKVMDLCYCPFEKTCALCDRRQFYLLTDEEGRKFPLRRYRTTECRFELYNCAPLSSEGKSGVLVDLTAVPSAAPTRGHSERSML